MADIAARRVENWAWLWSLRWLAAGTVPIVLWLPIGWAMVEALGCLGYLAGGGLGLLTSIVAAYWTGGKVNEEQDLLGGALLGMFAFMLTAAIDVGVVVAAFRRWF